MHDAPDPQLQALEKQNRILQKKLQRSLDNQVELEKVNEVKEALLRKAIQNLQTSEAKLRDSQAQLIQSEKMSSLGQLVAGIAHELNNPTGFIHGNLHFALTYAEDLMTLLAAYQAAYPVPPAIANLLEDFDLDFVASDFTKVLHSIRTGAERIETIVRSLRTFSRLDESDCKWVNLHEGIDSTLMILEHRLKSNQIQLIKAYSALPLVECYPGDLNQVFLNLLSNAIDAIATQAARSPKAWQPTLTIQTQNLSEWVRVSILDNGIGIPPEIQARLFDPFFTTKPIGQGTGLGLSISYQIITERHQGRLYCRSNAETEFHLEIPCHQKKEGATIAPSPMLETFD
jgi:signal transduction histidine kinase